MIDPATLLDLEVDTPALVLELDALEANIQAMAAFVRARELGLRPHAKTHKCAAIGRLQLEAGAVGLCCAKLGEAEALAAEGLHPLLITGPIVGPRKLQRLALLALGSPGLMVAVDDVAAAEALALAMATHGPVIDVLVDVDPGMARTGAATPEAALAVARAVEGAPNLRLRGVQCYAGTIQHIADAEARAAAAEPVHKQLREVVDALAAAELPCEVVTGSGTGTFALDATGGPFSEVQVGSYAVMDDEYAPNQPLVVDEPTFTRSAFLLTQVVSANRAGRATIDAGSKSLSFDGPLPSVQAPMGLVYERAGDEFGTVVGAAAPGVGERVLLGLPHCDPTINLHDAFVCVRDGVVVDRWPITARGRAD
ncbi:MAG: DSD1 family PLP-dependent enzyme [Alphaproteobacteria bacterium]|nr:DSD1 family PLP-dependent enzyme [Alphaproteobacteria bacterium]